MYFNKPIFVSAVVLIAKSIGVQAQAYYSQPLPLPCIGDACVSDKATDTSSLQYQDTTAIRGKNGLWYRFSKGNNTGLGLNVVTAPNLNGTWNYAYQILNGPLKSLCGASDKQATSWRWAPEIHYVNGTYFLFYTVETPATGCFDNCVATSADLSQGSWIDRGSLNIPVPSRVPARGGPPDDPYVRLDGNVLATSSDPHGVVYPPYMVFGSYKFGLYGIQLTDTLLSIKSGAVPQLIIADQYQTPNPTAKDGNKAGNYSEGPYQLINGKYIYLFYSRGDCCAAGIAPIPTVYQTQVCRTLLSNGPTGPYLDRNGENCATGGSMGWNRTGSIFLYSNNNSGNLATVFAPGSVGVTKDVDGSLIMYYQYQNNTSGKPNLGFGYNYLRFDSNDWPYLTAK